jgi:membrane protein DedA with SNARE-associated domain
VGERLGHLLERLLDLPEPVLHLILALVAALENVLPPIPADVVVLFGGFLASQGDARLWLVFLAVWVGNVSGALVVYGLGRRYGVRFFAGRWGRFLLRPRQLASLSQIYQRYGFGVVFISRFVPMFRAVVPVFAGISHFGFFRTAIPIAAASGIWYGMLVYLGAAAGENWEQIVSELERGGRWLYLLAAAAVVVLVVWWRRTRSVDEGKSP